ncbi:uncharacterized protein Dvir_GJ26783 [Drosophila virilis]|uniref:Uncharacterized protein n=1 Tax=Drosophila virilis TaxID=7244 RepID=A0A0Q9WBA9_DROVI|nr:uncharacterized protein Dvir_GJ26783 [Drosophila virilis]
MIIIVFGVVWDDPATTRIPRLDGISRIPPPGSFGGTTSHIRPPTALKSSTQIFRAPAAPANSKARPISSYHPAAAPLHDLGASIKKSASGERLNNAVSLISKRTTNVLKKYFGQGKMMGASVGGIQGAAASSLMTSSLPHTPLPAAKQPQQQQQQEQQQRQPQCLLTSSTPMPLMRSETFVCNEEEQQLREREPKGEQSQMQLTLSGTPTLNRTRLENTRLSSVGFGRTLDLDATLIDSSSSLSRTRTVIVDKKEQPEQLDSNATQLVSPLSFTRLATSSAQVDRTRTVIPASDEPADATQLLGNISGDRADRTRPVIPASDVPTEQLDATQLLANLSCSRADRTRPVVSEAADASQLNRADRTRTINAAGGELSHELNLDLTKSVEKLPLLEHMSMPSGLDLLMNGIKSDLPLDAELDNTELDVTLTALAPDKSTMKLPLNSTINTERLLDISGLQSPARHIQLLNLTREFLEQTPQRLPQHGAGSRSMPQHSLVCLTPQSATTTPHGSGRYQQTPVPVHLLSPLLKAARSDLVLPTRTPEGELLPPHLVDGTLGAAVQLRTPRTRYSFGLELQESTLDSSLELQLRLEQTPSPEELPLDPIEPQLTAALAAPAPANAATAAVVVAAAPAAPKLSNSFITSVTSVTSLDTGYQGDGEMSRPASRGACDHSPSNGPHLGRVSRQPSFPPMPAAPAAPMRRQDPMTDSDFFTESDADDVLQRGDRRAQVIDGQLYGPAMQPSASVPQLEDSCMESSGIFTDVENRCDEEMRLPELEPDIEMEMEMDMSPDESTQTLRKAQGQAHRADHQQQQHSHVDGGSAKSFCDEAFNSSSDQQQQQQQPSQQRSSVQRAASPRPHASLTSLCTVENFNSASLSSSSSLASPKSSCKITTTTSTANKKSPLTARSVKTPNKWDAVMHKIASNKSTIKTNYNDVKSKVSTTRNMAGSGSGSGAGGSAPRSPSSSSGSPRISPTVRRSPSGTPLVKRSSSVRPTNATPTTSTSTRQPQDKGSVGVGAGVNVFARLSKSQSPTSPTAAAAAAKRLQPVLVKRGRSYSKDSQKSSHSDLSSLCNGNGNGSGSPKLLAKTPLRK